MRRDPEYGGEKNKRQSEERNRTPYRKQPRKSTEGHGNALASAEAVEQRKGMADHRSGKHKRLCGRAERLCSGAACEKEYRSKALQKIEDKRQSSAPKAAVHKGVGCAGILILALLKHPLLLEYSCKYAGV